jgi:hypothetical protein
MWCVSLWYAGVQGCVFVCVWGAGVASHDCRVTSVAQAPPWWPAGVQHTRARSARQRTTAAARAQHTTRNARHAIPCDVPEGHALAHEVLGQVGGQHVCREAREHALRVDAQRRQHARRDAHAVVRGVHRVIHELPDLRRSGRGARVCGVRDAWCSRRACDTRLRCDAGLRVAAAPLLVLHPPPPHTHTHVRAHTHTHTHTPRHATPHLLEVLVVGGGRSLEHRHAAGQVALQLAGLAPACVAHAARAHAWCVGKRRACVGGCVSPPPPPPHTHTHARTHARCAHKSTHAQRHMRT